MKFYDRGICVSTTMNVGLCCVGVGVGAGDIFFRIPQVDGWFDLVGWFCRLVVDFV